MKRPPTLVLKFISVIFAVFFTLEFLVYYVVQFQCDWPGLPNKESDVIPVRAMIIADTHLLGSRNGHWFDKLRREWQMHRAFQSAITLHNPELVFILGDLFDEGLWCPEKEFSDVVERFNRLFRVPQETTVIAAAGNHDIGFHYEIKSHRAHRFAISLKADPVSLVTIRDVHFVIINSMAMEGDGCQLCHEAETQLRNISSKLKCAKGIGKCDKVVPVAQYSRPILLQHFPLYRQSDSLCDEWDSPPLHAKTKQFRENWDCLSRESTEMLQEELRFRVAWSGHTHHGCVSKHGDATEYTVASFSWRNRNDPSYILAEFTPEEYNTFKCAMPKESTVLTMYYMAGFILSIIIIKISSRICRASYRRKNH